MEPRLGVVLAAGLEKTGFELLSLSYLVQSTTYGSGKTTYPYLRNISDKSIYVAVLYFC